MRAGQSLAVELRPPTLETFSMVKVNPEGPVRLTQTVFHHNGTAHFALAAVRPGTAELIATATGPYDAPGLSWTFTVAVTA
jgi:hypothetical protein